jgi:hypothetical protein
MTTERPDQPLSTLRGAGVEVDARRVGRVILALCLVGLTVAVVVLFVAGAHKNSQITRLRQHGVPVSIIVTGCTGQLGGSGSNAAGYSCRGTFTVNGHRYDEAIPGSTFYRPGATFHGIRVPGDPALLSSVGAVADEHASGSVFILPSVLLVVLVVSVGALILRRRRDPGASAQSPPTTHPPNP